LAERFAGLFSEQDCMDRVRTLDSFLLHVDCVAAKRLYIDEGLMAHAGQLMAVRSRFRGLEEFYILGDPKQVTFVNLVKSRIPTLSYKNISDRLNVEWQYTTYRLSVKVAVCALHIYDGMLRVCDNASEGRVEVVKIMNIKEVPNKPHGVYLSHYQHEKQELMRGGYDKSRVCNEHTTHVSSVVEFQGDAADDVNLVRFQVRDNVNMLYSADDRVNSSVTRSRNKMVYYTMNDTDKTSVWLRLMQTEENYKRVRGEYDVVDANGVRHYNKLKPWVAPDFRRLCRDNNINSADYR